MLTLRATPTRGKREIVAIFHSNRESFQDRNISRPVQDLAVVHLKSSQLTLPAQVDRHKSIIHATVITLSCLQQKKCWACRGKKLNKTRNWRWSEQCLFNKAKFFSDSVKLDGEFCVFLRFFFFLSLFAPTSHKKLTGYIQKRAKRFQQSTQFTSF